MRRWLYPLAIACLVSMSADAPRLAPTAAAGCIPRWREVGNSYLDLSAVAAVSSTDVWAVGTTGHEFATTPVIAHWDGHKLHVTTAFRPTVYVKSADEGRQLSGELSGIAAINRDDIWAVGTDGESKPVVLHWDGRKWRRASIPRLRASAGLSTVAAISSHDVWAVGQVGTRPLAMHWDGRRWQVIDIRREGALGAVDGSSSGDVWAVGAQGLTGPSINDVSGLVMHWDGHRWKEVKAVDRDDSDLGSEADNAFDAVEAVSPSLAWALHSGSVRSDLQRWDGQSWQIAKVFAQEQSMDAIAAVTDADVWVVGTYIGHWDGRAWHLQQPSFLDYGLTLRGLSALSPTDIWAVGKSLVARYSC